MKKILAVLALAIGLSTTAVACSSQPVVYPMPATMAVSYMGTNYCGFRYYPDELLMYGAAVPGGVYDPITNPYGCRPYQFPANSVGFAVGSIDALMFNQLETYSPFYNSGYWYDQYLAPMGPRYHVTIISRRTYVNTADTFAHTYATQINQRQSGAVYKGKSGTIYGNYKFPTSNSNAANKPATSARSSVNSGSFGTDNSRSSTSTVGKPGTGTTRSVSNSTTRRH